MRSGDPTDRRATALLAGLFLVSGACALIYEVVWVRMLVLVFGVSVFAVSTVLSSFMAGLALGSVGFGRIVDRTRRPLLVYAVLEVAIGAYALVLPAVFQALDDVYTSLYRSTGGGTLFLGLRFLMAFAVLLLPTTCMGATLPVLTKVVVRRVGHAAARFGALYALNTLGAVVGCALAAYVLIERLGTTRTTYVAAAGNFLVALVAFALARAMPPAGTPIESGLSAEPVAPPSARPSPAVVRLAVWGLAASGFAALGYEVVWSRMLSLILGITTIQSLSTILIVFLLGIALGGALGARWAHALRRPVRAFAVCQLALGVLALASVAILALVPDIVAGLRGLPSWWGHMLRLVLATAAVMLAPTILMGLAFPLAARLSVERLGRLGSDVGRLYAANTAGAILGAFAAGFVLVPSLGTHAAVQLLATCNLAVGLAGLLVEPGAGRSTRLVRAAAAALVAAIVLVAAPDAVRSAIERSRPGAILLHYEEQSAGTITVHQQPNGQRVLSVNGAGEVPTDHASIQTFRLLGHLPMLLREDPGDVLLIAYGGGVTLAAIERHAPRRIDCVEVVPGVVPASRFFSGYNDEVYRRLRGGTIDLIVEDGRNHVLRTPRRYDAIISDSTHPATADSWILYTREFYRLCRERLDQGGLMAQWLPLHGLTEDEFRMILRTFREVFPHATLWVTKRYGVMLGTWDALRVDPAALRDRLARDDGLRERLAEVDLGDAEALLAALALDEAALERYVGPGPVNTDDRPYISFRDRYKTGGGTGLPVMVGLAPLLVERVGPWLVTSDTTETSRMERRLQARKLTFLGDVELRMGRTDRAREAYGRALAVDPNEPGAQRMLWRLR